MEHYFTNNKNLRSELRTIPYEIDGNVFTFFSDLGVFSKNKIDYGSNILVKTMIKQITQVPQSILDVGCGYGYLMIVLSKIYQCSCLGVDINERSVHLCKKNIQVNQVHGDAKVSDVYDNVNGLFDIIVTNPPVRAGKNVVLKILKGAKKHLSLNGKLWFVMRKDQGVKSILKELETDYECEIMKKSNGFYVIVAKIR